MGRHHRLIACLLAALSTPALAQPTRDTLTIGITQYPSTFHPNIENMAAKSYVLGFARRPLTAYGADWAQLPNKISLFRLPLEQDFADPDELADEVRRTVIHELAHHAGIDDARLAELDLD